jgi:hypothetical protein
MKKWDVGEPLFITEKYFCLSMPAELILLQGMMDID